MKRNSGIIGDKKEPTEFDGSSGVFGLHDQYIEKRNGTWPNVKKYLSCTESTSSLSEGNAVTFTVTTEALPAESTLYYTISTLSGTTMVAADFGGTAISNSFGHNDNSTVLSFTLTAEYPGDAESNSFKLQIRTGSTSGTIQVESGTVTVTDVIGASGGGVRFTTTGSHSWTAPAGVTSVCVVCIGGGGGGMYINNTNVAVKYSMAGGGGGALAWLNDYTVTPGDSYSIVVGAAGAAGAYTAGSTAGGDSWAFATSICNAGGGGPGRYNSNIAGGSGTVSTAYGTSGSGDGGAVVSAGANVYGPGGGGGAGGYSGTGGTGRDDVAASGDDGAGGGGAGGGPSAITQASGGGVSTVSGGGGGTGVYGEGSNGTASTDGWGGGGSGGEGGGTDYHGSPGGAPVANELTSINGGDYGGGGGGQSATIYLGTGAGAGGQGAVRIIWGSGKAFPSTNVEYTDNQTTV
jgi:hypothetical protein